MDGRQKNREVVSTIGELVSALFLEVEALPLSDKAKQALVMVMVSEIMKRDGRTVNYYVPLQSGQEVAA